MPATQLVQLLEPAAKEYVPAEHKVHDVEAAVEKDPAEHGIQVEEDAAPIVME